MIPVPLMSFLHVLAFPTLCGRLFIVGWSEFLGSPVAR